VSASLLELCDSRDAETLVDQRDFLRPDTGDAQHLKDGVRKLRTQSVELSRRTMPVEFFDRGGDCRSNAWDLALAPLRHDRSKRHRQREEAFSCPRVGAGLVRALVGKREPLADLDQETGDVVRFHFGPLRSTERFAGGCSIVNASGSAPSSMSAQLTGAAMGNPGRARGE